MSNLPFILPVTPDRDFSNENPLLRIHFAQLQNARFYHETCRFYIQHHIQTENYENHHDRSKKKLIQVQKRTTRRKIAGLGFKKFTSRRHMMADRQTPK